MTIILQVTGKSFFAFRLVSLESKFSRLNYDFHYLNLSEYPKITKKITLSLILIFWPSCVPCGICNYSGPQIVSTWVKYPKAAWETVNQIVLETSLFFLVNFWSGVTVNFIKRSPLGPFSLWFPFIIYNLPFPQG